MWSALRRCMSQGIHVYRCMSMVVVRISVIVVELKSGTFIEHTIKGVSTYN